MAKHKLIKLVFSNIFNRRDNIHTVNEFVNSDVLLNTPDLVKYKDIYVEIVNKITADINALADLEEIISQLRCKEIDGNDIKLSITGNFIYAKTVFYRNTNKCKDIRIIAGKVNELLIDNKSLLDLYDDKAFMSSAVDKLKTQMQKEINKLIPALEQNLEKYAIFAQ